MKASGARPNLQPYEGRAGLLSRQGAQAARDSAVYLVGNPPDGCRQAARQLSPRAVVLRTFASVAEYLEFDRPELPACILVHLDGLDAKAADLCDQLTGGHPPIVFTSAHNDARVAVRALKAGAVDFLVTPLSNADIRGALETAMQRDIEQRESRLQQENIHRRYCTLTPREKEVLPLLLQGYLNKQSAAVLGIREVTLQVHRRSILHKMRTRSLVELARTMRHLHAPLAAIATDPPGR